MKKKNPSVIFVALNCNKSKMADKSNIFLFNRETCIYGTVMGSTDRGIYYSINEQSITPPCLRLNVVINKLIFSSVNIIWAPSHIDIEGNENVDGLACSGVPGNLVPINCERPFSYFIVWLKQCTISPQFWTPSIKGLPLFTLK